MSYHNLGKIEQMQKNVSQASEFFQKSIRIISSNFDEQNELLLKLQNDFKEFMEVSLKEKYYLKFSKDPYNNFSNFGHFQEKKQNKIAVRTKIYSEIEKKLKSTSDGSLFKNRIMLAKNEKVANKYDKYFPLINSSSLYPSQNDSLTNSINNRL